MTQEKVYNWQILLDTGDFDGASKLFGAGHAELLKRKDALRRSLQLVVATGSLRDRETAEGEAAELDREYRLYVDDYNTALEVAAVKALERSGDTVKALREEVRDLDNQLLEALQKAWDIHQARTSAELRRDKAQKLLAKFASKYPRAGVNISAGRGAQTAWGRGLTGSGGEITRYSWRSYADRFAQVKSSDLDKFIKGV